MHTYEQTFLISLVLTVLSETIVLVCIGIFSLKRKSWPEIGTLCLAGIFASSLTLPYLWFILPTYIPNYTVFFLVGEIAVWFIEGVFYRFFLQLRFRDALLISLACNLSSILVGETIRHLY